MSDGEAYSRPRMEDAWRGQPAVDDPAHLRPRRAVPLASALERASPQVSHVMLEGAQRRDVGGHGVVIVPAGDHALQPSPLFGDRRMPPTPEFLLEFMQLGAHPVGRDCRRSRKPPRRGASADVRASRPTGFRRQPLLDPCMNLSAHTAPIRRTCPSCRYASERTGSSSPGPAFVENGWRVFCEP